VHQKSLLLVMKKTH